MADLPVRRERRDALPARWDPLRETEDLRERIERLFEDVVGGASPVRGGVWSPPVDLEESDEAWVVEADLPGVKKSDVTVELRDSELAIHGEVKERERTGILRRRTRRTGQFDYRVGLPGDVDSDADIDAQLDDGVLTVRIPKAARASHGAWRSRAADRKGRRRGRPRTRAARWRLTYAQLPCSVWCAVTLSPTPNSVSVARSDARSPCFPCTRSPLLV